MLPLNLISNFFTTNKKLLWLFGSVLLVMSLNLGISFLVRQTGINYIGNSDPLGLKLGLFTALSLILFISWVLIYSKIYQRYFLFTVFLLAGIWSNYSELALFFGEATDYIYTPIAYFNLADIQIWTSVICLNLLLWFGQTQSSLSTELSTRQPSQALD